MLGLFVLRSSRARLIPLQPCCAILSAIERLRVAAGGQRESKLGLANVHLLAAQLKLVGRRGGGDDVLEGVFGVASREERAMHLWRGERAPS